MSQRNLDGVSSRGTMSTENVQLKTKRSHEENQERAYIAASRRADRSIEARVQSAHRASDIHKKRTGKAFKISEEIVMKEEMYEEDDDDLPRYCPLLAGHMQNYPNDANSRLKAYLANQAAVATLTHQQEVNRMFAEQFPNVSQISQNLSQPMHVQPLQQQSATNPIVNPDPAQLDSVDYSLAASASPEDQSSSMVQSVNLASPSQMAVLSPSSISHDKTSSLLPSLKSSDTESSPSSPSSFKGIPPYPDQGAPSPLDLTGPSLSSMASSPALSSFGTEPPPEVKQMVNRTFNDSLAHNFLGGDKPPDGEQQQYVNVSLLPSVTIAVTGANGEVGTLTEEPYQQQAANYFDSGSLPAPRFLSISSPRSNIGTPGGGVGDSWELWINTDQWPQLQADEQC